MVCTKLYASKGKSPPFNRNPRTELKRSKTFTSFEECERPSCEPLPVENFCKGPEDMK